MTAPSLPYRTKTEIYSTMKRSIARLTIPAALAALMLFAACDDLTGMNDDPNQPGQATIPYLFTNSLNAAQEGRTGVASNYWGEFNLGYFGNMYSQYWSLNQYTAESRYAFPTARSGVVNDMWEDYYLALNDLQSIIETAREQPEVASVYGDPDNIIAMSQILQVWTFQVMTDIWGPIPFTEALEGIENPSPAYTAQSEIYPAMLDTLDAAIARIDPAGTAIASGDIIYNGDMSQWLKFGNALRMRVAIRMADRNDETGGRAAEAVQASVESGTFTSNEDNALVPFLEGSPYQNPLYVNNVVDGRDDWAVSEPLVATMEADDDPRLSIYAQPAPDGEFVGFPYGMSEGAAQALYSAGRFSRPSELVYASATSPALFLLYDEVLFIQAEAAQRGWIAGDPAQLYRDAIQASMDFWGVDDQDAIDAYIAANPYDAANWRESIGEQKWLALYMQGVQGWSEWRRLDFEDVLVPPVAGPIPDFGLPIAVRLTFPDDEHTLNTDNVQQAVDNYLGGEDTQGVRLWWDVTPPPVQ